MAKGGDAKNQHGCSTTSNAGAGEENLRRVELLSWLRRQMTGWILCIDCFAHLGLISKQQLQELYDAAVPI